MKKNIYVKPGMVMVNLVQRHMICASADAYGMNSSFQEEEVQSSWTKESGSVWDNEW